MACQETTGIALGKASLDFVINKKGEQDEHEYLGIGRNLWTVQDSLNNV